MTRIAVIGAGWAGCAAALKAARLGHEVHVFEAAKVAGGRARRVELGGQVLDNGQHILIGAYTDTLALLKSLGLDEQTAFLRTPLQLLKPDGTGLRTSARLAKFPRHAVAGAVLGARGWGVADKLSLMAVAMRWEWQHFDCDPSFSVGQVCKGLSAKVMADLIEPLCVSALNTPAARASGRVFLRVMHDAMFSQAGGSDYLLPKLDLTALLPDLALAEVQQLGGRAHMATRVQALARTGSGMWQVRLSESHTDEFDAVVIATAPWDAARLSREHASAWALSCDALRFESIATVYLQSSPPTALPAPILALASSSAEPAQFAFDRGQLGGPPGLWALVVSASVGDATELEAAVVAQAKRHLAGTAQIEVKQTIVEKRATFACEPGTQRPGAHIAPGLVAVGDYVDGPYPATLEGAIRSVRFAWPNLAQHLMSQQAVKAPLSA